MKAYQELSTLQLNKTGSFASCGGHDMDFASACKMNQLKGEDSGSESPQPFKRLSNLTKSKVNMQLLKDYNCKVEKRKNNRGGITTVYTCNYKGCNKEFTRTWSILDHVRMHEGVRPYVWKFCSRTYTQKGNMIKHMRRHTEPDVDSRRSYICEFWNKGYTEKYNLKVSELSNWVYIKLHL